MTNTSKSFQHSMWRATTTIMALILSLSFNIVQANTSIQGYQPKITVTDYAALDLDLQLIKEELSKARKTAFNKAQDVYQHGTYSRPVAELVLDKPLIQSFPYLTEVAGLAYDGSWSSIVSGHLHRPAFKGDTVVQVMYEIKNNVDDYVNCLVKAQPVPETEGCFAEEGEISLPAYGLSFNYTYNVMEENWNARSFQVQTHYSRERLHECANCPKPDYQKFVNYYGAYDYADKIIMRAFEQYQTDFLLGNHDFRAYGWAGLKAMIENSIVWLVMWMEVISRMERSIDVCLDEGGNNDLALEFWDSAVAFYAGSQVSSENGGLFLFHLANTRCLSASTCGEDGKGSTGTAWVNYKILDNFQLGQGQVNAKNCEAARKTKEEIVRLMTIPIVQGALQRAQVIALEGGSDEVHRAEAAAFAAAVAPLVHVCSPQDAEIIMIELRAHTGTTVILHDVQEAFGRNLGCMGLTCDEIGLDLGFDSTHEFCQATTGQIEFQEAIGEEKASMNFMFWVFIGCVALVFVILIARSRRKRVDQREIQSTFTDTVSEIHHDDAAAAAVASADAVENIVKGSDYVPKYWKDSDQPNDKPEDDNLPAEIL